MKYKTNKKPEKQRRVEKKSVQSKIKISNENANKFTPYVIK